MNLNHATNKTNGSTLSASEWNNLAADVNELGTGGATGGSSDSHVSFDSTGKHNLNITTTAEDQYQDGNKTKGGKINIEPISDLQIKPGDDIIMCSHHREDPTEVSVKIHDGEDHPVKLQLNAADILLTTKDKGSTKTKDENGDDTNTALYDDPNVLNVTVNSAKNTRGYLKVRAQAIDLRCEANGGIALQPKGNDGDGHENKIKFEHNGGDGKEFGTFNTEKTSIFTDEYRFNEAGTVYAVTRGALETTYKIPGDSDSGIKKIDYPTQADDFKDIVDQSKGATWGDIVKTASAMNNDQIETRIADYESIGKRGLLISGRKCVRVISNSRSEIQALIDNSDPNVDQVSISTDNTTTAEMLSNTYYPFTETFPAGEILDIEKLKYTAGRYTGLEAYLYELSLHDNGYKRIIYFTNSQDVALFLEVVTYDITFATEQPFYRNLQNPDTDPLWPEHSVSVSDLIKLVEWFKNTANISNMGSVNPFNVSSPL